ncbi:MAG TPA: 2-phospho-L-lactate guanylyltransferase [Candidatus Binataceae bacterium]|nr:2-phospho-L-lactate guanylyltransferase [Candidatus Binataceae bacterium]
MRVILIAAKELSLAKTRLSSVMPDGERVALAEAMYRDVLAAALGSRAAEMVAVVSSDRTLLELARGAGAMAIDEGYARGLNVAVAMATATLAAHGATTQCTVLSDIPMITAADMDAVFGAIENEPAVVLVPSRDFSGTNVIARSPAAVIPTRFGRQSLAKHLDDCRARAVRCEVLRLARPALDLDLVNDLYEFVRTASTTHTLNQLSRLGIAHH